MKLSFSDTLRREVFGSCLESLPPSTWPRRPRAGVDLYSTGMWKACTLRGVGEVFVYVCLRITETVDIIKLFVENIIFFNIGRSTFETMGRIIFCAQ